MNAAIILAAGAASRMGAPKQLLSFGGMTLLERAIAGAREAGLNPIIVVTGAHGTSVAEIALRSGANVAENPGWESGMGSSIAAGMRALESSGQIAEAVVILPVDQPLVESAHLAAMAVELRDGKTDIVAAEFGGTLGSPAFFRRTTFGALATLPATAGAKHLFRDGRFTVHAFPLPEAASDVDTPADFIRVAGQGPEQVVVPHQK